MTVVFASLSMSLDGFIAGPNASPANALGDGGDRLHQWMYEAEAWRERQEEAGGQANRDDEIVRSLFARAGAYVMGRNMFDEGEVGWSDPPPFRAPVFVLTSRPREPWVRQGGTTFTFVTEGFEPALRSARQVAGGKDVHVAGGAKVVQQALELGLLDELQIHLAPVMLGKGARLFDDLDPDKLILKPQPPVGTAYATHLTYCVGHGRERR